MSTRSDRCERSHVIVGRTHPHTVSVVICAYADERWPDLEAATASVRRQTPGADEVIIVVDHNPKLLDRVRRDLHSVIAVENAWTRGLSGARNSGIDAARGEIVVFLDDDAAATDGWLAYLLAHFADPGVMAVGGQVRPVWDVKPPSWLPAEFHWVVGCSYHGLPTAPAPIRNPIGANMAFRREVFDEIGGFRSGIGRVGAVPVGCEETELCIRARQRWPDRTILYEPRAVVHHRVSVQRATWQYFRSRCYAEGRSKALVSGLVGPEDGLASERTYTLKTLPLGAARGLWEGAARATVIGAGLAITTLGYAGGRIAARAGPGRTTSLRDATDEKQNVKGQEDVATSSKWITFNIHNRAAMRVARDAPTASLLADMFAPFLTTVPADHYDLTITGDVLPIDDVSYGETEYEYTDQSLLLTESNVQILRDEDGWRLNGARELLVSAVPLIDRILVTRGVAMIHAATVGYHGYGISMPAWGGTGKTSTIAKLLKRDGFSFMGDDWAFLDDEGRLLGYAKPMFIKPHHRRIYPHLFQKRRKPLAPVRLSRPLGRLTTMVHPLITRYPRLARATRKLSPEHMMVTPREAFPDAVMTTEAPLAISVFVERFAGNRVVLHEKDNAWMVSRLIGNFHAEITRHSQAVITALGAAGLVPIEQTFAEKAAVLRRALADKPAFLLQVPQELTPDQASDAIVAELEGLMARHAIAPALDVGTRLNGNGAGQLTTLSRAAPLA